MRKKTLITKVAIEELTRDWDLEYVQIKIESRANAGWEFLQFVAQPRKSFIIFQKKCLPGSCG
jgi:hypothetical protein